ncbi:MAG: RNB domain-containing ribonuclease [Candidatus Micrarchaeia archaeon]|jgi:exoribonuclease-2
MTRFNRVRAKARSRSDSRSPANSRPRGRPQEEPEPKQHQNKKYAERARKRAIREAEENAKRMPALNLQMLAQDAMEKYGFSHKLSLVVNAKANAHDGFTIKKVGAALRDLRHLMWSSIDSYYSHGVDQMAFCERGQRREILVKVAIADVDAFAPKGSILDEHAEANATSVYPGKESYPMLPEQLSGDLSAFPADCDRLAIVAEFAVLPRGNVRFGKICRAFVRNKAELSTGEISAWLDGQARQAGRGGKGGEPEEAGCGDELLGMFEEMPGLAEQVLLQEEASERLGSFRAEMAGAPVSEDRTLGLCTAEKDRAKSIIENFMVCANKGMMGLLETARVPSIRRVVVIPKDWYGVAEAAGALGFTLPAEPDAGALSEFLAREKKENPAGFPDLSASIAKLLGPGEYALLDKREPIEYFCIAGGDYLVGTSPNHCYMDLVVQRLVKAAVAHTPTPYSKAELAEIAAWCSERENAAKKVERTVAYASGPDAP